MIQFPKLGCHAGGCDNRMGLVRKSNTHTPTRSAAVFSSLVELVAQEPRLKITGTAVEMPLEDYYVYIYVYIDVLHMPPGTSTIAADPKLRLPP